MTEPYSEQVFRRFVEDLNSSKPAPGGGSAAAFTGAMASALAGMTAHMTVGKKSYAAVEEEMRDVIARSGKLQQEMLLLAQEDADVFGLVLDAYRMPRGTRNSSGRESCPSWRPCVCPKPVSPSCAWRKPSSARAAACS